jgi:hypothetical protein
MMSKNCLLFHYDLMNFVFLLHDLGLLHLQDLCWGLGHQSQLFQDGQMMARNDLLFQLQDQ